ncbi:hypothetical protein EMIHUDRAFT_209055 [Emiliania huxleyi CCMP1516]|uniref:Ferroxidase n=2 Tax=Emiliania huxleyi TaxID=2903 RepID=A0A0D3J7L0_EMIH1|nr:hypothetical protein EMIHUDRAFT_209055 [Emiliania huxleyi CCMP1516]EOD19495.1 hypothetical protein EMIHUDRAFT_209055 [Emiliania huxleyi CCMP1516]|eukprot:XP_005771924.1 hypothetical protein EMIHUDRAFT_209055 [Emiliania huxleyi CCMP1516]
MLLQAQRSLRRVACARPRPALASSSSEAGAAVSLVVYHAVLETLGDKAPAAGIDVECAADVLNLEVGEASFVLNKQAPNLQLWLSSPARVRGPLRYDFDAGSARWLNNRDAHPLLPTLADDIQSLCGEAVDFGAVEEDVSQLYLEQLSKP